MVPEKSSSLQAHSGCSPQMSVVECEQRKVQARHSGQEHKAACMRQPSHSKTEKRRGERKEKQLEADIIAGEHHSSKMDYHAVGKHYLKYSWKYFMQTNMHNIFPYVEVPINLR